MEIDDSTVPAEREDSSLALKELTLKALEANKAHQYALTKRAEQLTRELSELEKLMSASTASDGEESDTEIHIPGAKRVRAPLAASELLKIESPFYEDASRRMRYLNDTTEHPMKNRELEALADAVRSENQRLQAYESQRHGESGGITIDIENNTEGLDWTVIAEKVSSVSTFKRTADQCRIKWLGNRHPKINHNEWDTAELENLRELVSTQLEENDGKVDWVLVAKTLGTNRNPLDCMRRGIPRQRHTWNHISDQKLFDTVQLYGTDNWNLVARVVSEDATAGQCQGRYFRALDPSLKRGPWSDEEFSRLKAAVSAHGNAWVDVASCIPGRTNEQCRERWMEYLKVGSAPPVWSEEDDGVLLDAVAEMGHQWKAISAKLTNGATGAQCRIRHDKLKKLQALRMSAAAGPSSLPPPQSTKRKHDGAATKKVRARNAPGASQAGEDTESAPAPVPVVPKARPQPRPVGKGKAKQKETDTEANPPPPGSSTPDVSAVEQDTTPLAGDDLAPSAPAPAGRKRRAAGEGTAAKKRKTAQNGLQEELEAVIPDTTGTRTSPRRHRHESRIGSESTSALSATNDEAATAETDASDAMPKRKGRAKAKATTSNDADKAVPVPPRRSVGRPRKTAAASVDTTDEAFAVEPRAKPRPRGRPKKVTAPEAPSRSIVDESPVLPSEETEPPSSSMTAPSKTKTKTKTKTVSITPRRQSARVAAQQAISPETPQDVSDDAMVVDPEGPAAPVPATEPPQETQKV